MAVTPSGRRLKFPSLFSLVFLSLLLLDEYSQFGHALLPEMPKEHQELLDWQPPRYIAKSFPYFLSGYDNEGSPVWIAEVGRWNVREILDSKDEQKIRDMDKYFKQGVIRIFESPRNLTKTKKNADDEDEPVEDFVVIQDADGFDEKQFSHPPTLAKLFANLRESAALEQKYGKRMKQGYSINNNFFGVSVWNLSKPVLGEIANRIQFFGTNRDKWLPVIKKNIPVKVLPPWLGGEPNFTPVEVYG